MSSIDELRSLIHEYISAQAKRDAERDKRDAERDKRDAERDKLAVERDKLAVERDKRDAEQKADFERRWKLLQQELGKLGNSYGDQIEAMFVNLGSKFNALGYDFPKETKGTIFIGKDRKILAEVDRLLENGNVIMPIEVKAKLKQDHVDDHIRRLDIISKYNADHNDNRKIIGAVAGGVVSKNVLEYAQKRGLYVLIQNGDSIEIADLPSNFKPQEW